MTLPPPPELEFPSMLYGFTEDIFVEVEAQGRQWSREYLATGRFSLPEMTAQVPPGEPLFMDGEELECLVRSSWHIHMFMNIFPIVTEEVPNGERQRMNDAFETFCVGTPWGALYHAVTPPPKRSAERMASRFTALLRFWDVLQSPRYAFREIGTRQTLDELIRYIYRATLEAWCPGHFSSVREHLAQVAQRMAHATREDSIEAMLLVIPYLLHSQPKLPHREVLGNPDFVRARLAETSPGDFEDASSADRFRVNGLLHAWSRKLSQH